MNATKRGIASGIVIALMGAGAARAATCTWQPAAAANYSPTTSNWSCGRVPTSSDDVVFDGTGGTNKGCTFNVAVSARSIAFQNGYTSTVTGSASTVTVANGWTMPTGTFSGGSGNITLGGDLSLTGGAFTASSGTTQIGGSFGKTGGTFGGNGGTIKLTGTSTGTVTSGGASFSALTVSGSGGTYTLQDALTATGTLTVTAGTLTAGANNVSLGGLTINGGTFNASSATTSVSGAFNRTSGTFNANGGTVYFNGTSSLSHTFGGSTLASVQMGLGTSGLVGYWKLDETSGTSAADSSGSGNTGTWNGSGVSRTTSVPSKISFSDPEAVTLDGSSGYVSLGVTNLPANDAPQSISLWFKGTPNASNQNMIAMSNLTTSSALQLGFRGAALIAWSYGGATLVSATAPTDGAWHQLVYSYDGTTDSLYLDGALSATAAGTHQTGTPTSAYLGTYSPSSELFGGSLDDVRVYSRALTAAEIAILAAGASPTTIAGTHTFSDAFACTGSFNILAGTVTGSSTLGVAGNWFNAGTYTDTGTVTLTGTSASGTITSGGSKFGALTINGAGGTYTLQDALSVTGNFSLAAGTLAGTKAIAVGGNWSNAGAFSDTGTVTLTGTSSSGTITSGGGRFSALTINGSAATVYTIADRLWVPGGTITLTNGTLNGGSSVTHVGAFSVGSGSFAVGTGTVVFDGASSQTLPLSSFSGLRIEDPQESNLVGYWKLDEGQGSTIRDLSGNGNTGTLSSSGVTWQTSVPATVGFDDYASASFNGSNGYATLGATGLPATSAAVTISAWVNFTSVSGNQNMVVLTGSGGNYLQLGIRNGSYAVWPSGAATSVTGPAAVINSWHQVAYTYDGASTDTIYVDGVAYPGTFTHQSGATTAAYLGTFSPAQELLNGALDDVRIYNVALTAKQVAQLAAGRYAGTGVSATWTLGANTTVSGQLAVDNGLVNANGKTLNASLATSAALVNSGTYTVGSAAQTFAGGLTVQPNGTLTLASSGGSVAIGSGKTLTIDGTLNASSTGATLKSVSGSYAFKVGSTASATPTLNISGLGVQNTDTNGMWIGATTAAVPTFTKFDNIAFSKGTGAQLLQIKASSLYLSSSGCTFDSGVAATTTYSVALAGDGTSNGETRAVFGGATCASNVASCQASKSDDDANGDGLGDNPSTNGAVAQFARSAQDDTAGSIIGFPTAAFDWNTFTYYSTYAAFHNASAGTNDVIYVRDESGNPLYSWTVPTAGETITGTPQWNTSGGTHYLFVATSAGHVYKLIDTGTGTTSGTLTLDTVSTGWKVTNPFNCACTITTPLAMDASNLYWGSTTASKNFWTLGQATQTNPTPVTISQTVTNTALAVATISSTSYAFEGVAGKILKISTAGQTITATNSSPGSASVLGRIAIGTNSSGTRRVYAGDDGGTMWAIDPGTNFATLNGLWKYNTANAIKSSPYYDNLTDTVQYGTQGGTIIVLNGTGAVLNASYPYTPAGGAGDAITTAPLYYSGVLAVGTSGGKLYFLDRNTGTTPAVSIIREYNFGPTESVSGIAFDPNVNRYMVTTASASANDGRLYYFDQLTDPTPGSS